MEFNRLIAALHFSRFFWVVCLVLLLLNLVFYTAFVRGQQDRIDELQRLYTQKREARVDRKNPAMHGYFKANDDLQLFKDKLPPKAAFADTVGKLSVFLSRRGLPVQRMTYSPESVTTSLALWKYSTSFTVTGTYAQLKGLLADIQNSPELYCIEDLSFLNRSKETEKVDMTLKIATYFR